MKVTIKDLSVNMELKNNGMELAVYDNKENFLGDLVITKSGLTWCKGKQKQENGKKVAWNKFIEWMQSDESNNK